MPTTNLLTHQSAQGQELLQCQLDLEKARANDLSTLALEETQEALQVCFTLSQEFPQVLNQDLQAKHDQLISQHNDLERHLLESTRDYQKLSKEQAALIEEQRDAQIRHEEEYTRLEKLADLQLDEMRAEIMAIEERHTAEMLQQEEAMQDLRDLEAAANARALEAEERTAKIDLEMREVAVLLESSKTQAQNEAAAAAEADQRCPLNTE